MAIPFNMTRDINGFNGFGLKPSDIIYSATLTANTDTSIAMPTTMPTGYGSMRKPQWIAIFHYTPGAEVWVANNIAASVPGGASFALTSSKGNPAAYSVLGGDVLHFFTTGTAVNVDISLYAI